MDYEFSMKELYDVFLKTTYPIEIAGRQYDAGETLCVFDKVQISNFNEIKNRITAHGGYQDRDHVFWEDICFRFLEAYGCSLQLVCRKLSGNGCREFW